MSKTRLFVIPGSHPAMAARLMLEHKGVEHQRIDLLPIISKGVLRAAGFPRNTVPAMRFHGERVQGTRQIAEALDRHAPEPRLIPEDPARRERVEEIEAWADEDLQGLTRRLLWSSLKREGGAIESYSQGARIGVPIKLAAKTAAPIIHLSARNNHATDEQVRQDLRDLPAVLDRVRGWIETGDLSADDPTLADFQVGSSLRLMGTLSDVRPALEAADLTGYAEAIAPDYPGHMPPALPGEWLVPVREYAEA